MSELMVSKLKKDIEEWLTMPILSTRFRIRLEDLLREIKRDE